jgi:uncharacterized protein (DUF1684 family)
VACSAGHGAKGRRLYDWARIQLGPASTSLVGLVRVAGSRWAIEEGFQQAKTEVGLASCWPGHDGGAATRPAPVAHTTNDRRERQARLE